MAVHKHHHARLDDMKRMRKKQSKKLHIHDTLRSVLKERRCVPPSNKKIFKTKRHTSTAAEPEGLSANVFHTTGVIANKRVCLEVTHMLIDSGASSCTISGIAARKAHLKFHKCKPQFFSTCNGQVKNDTYVKMKLYIAGVEKTMIMWVDENEKEDHVLLGKTAIKKFDMRLNPSWGRRKETRWSIAQPEHTGSRERLVLKEDLLSVSPKLRVLDLEEGLSVARKRGETTVERNQRERRERAWATLDRIMTNNGGVRSSDGSWMGARARPAGVTTKH